MMDYAELYRSMQISVEVMEKVLSPLSAYDCIVAVAGKMVNLGESKLGNIRHQIQQIKGVSDKKFPKCHIGIDGIDFAIDCISTIGGVKLSTNYKGIKLETFVGDTQINSFLEDVELAAAQF